MSTEYPARLYAAVHDGNPGDLSFYVRRCAGARAVVELGCGDARVLAALSEQDPDRTLVGVDIDPELIELAEQRRAGLAPQTAASLHLVTADMTDPSLPERLRALGPKGFDRVLLPHGSLYCLLDDASLSAALRNVAALLSEDGLLLLDAWAADEFHDEADPDDQSDDWLERVKVIELDEQPWEVLERSRWDKPAQRIDVTYLHVPVGEERFVEGLLRQRYLLSEQVRAALASAGLELRELSGSFDGEPFEVGSELLVVVAGLRR